MNIIADTHTHTIASGHAHSTVMENAAEAARMGHKFLVIADHAPQIPGAPTELYFRSMRNVLPESALGVYLLRGCEVNILDENGALDLPPDVLDRLDVVIASMHTLTFPPADEVTHTRAWLAVAKNPSVDIIGHAGDGRYPFDHEAAIRAFKENGKVVEINAHSFKVRKGSHENCRTIARLLKKYEVPVVVSTDAHFATFVGKMDAALELLRDVDFPEELVLNADARRFADWLFQKTGRTFDV
jgi:putative hydrolase